MIVRSMMSAKAMAALGVLAAALVLTLTVPVRSASASGCPNEPIRAEQQTFDGFAIDLPDCRAYELISQPYQPSPEYWKYYNGYPPSEGTALTLEAPEFMPMVQFGEFTAADGDVALFESSQPNSEGDGLATNLSRRTQDGWVGENLETYTRSRHSFTCNWVGYAGFSQNMEHIVWKDGLGGPAENETGGGDAEDCGHDEPELVPGEPLEAGRLFLRETNLATGAFEFQLVNRTPQGVPQYNPWFDAISADGSHVIFQTRTQLVSNAPDAETAEAGESNGHCASELGNVYVWSANAVHLLTVLPNGEPVRGTLAGAHHPRECDHLPAQSASFTDSVSADGERVLFYAGGGFKSNGQLHAASVSAPYIDGGLYLREHPGAEESLAHECTEAEQSTEPDKACTVQIDVPEGGSGNASGGQFQWANAQTTRIFFTDEEKLTSTATTEAGKPDLYEYDLEKPEGERLTDLTADASEAADVLGVSGASEDGSYVYFVAEGVLTGGQENSHGAKAVAGEANLYLSHDGTTTFIATLNARGGDQCDWITYCLTARVSQNGKFIAFDSIGELTGYNNHPVHPESCEHLTGVPDSPCMEAFRYAAEAGANGELTCATCNPTGAPPAAELGGWAVIEQALRETIRGGPMALNNAVSNSGQVFFETIEKLVQEDQNETWDVYEYAGGEGRTAQYHLISTGKSELPSFFVNATPDGSNVFFLTGQSLLRADTRADYDIYDARVNGGVREPAPQTACGEEGTCRASYIPTLFSPPGNVLGGTGNVHEIKCGKGLVRKHGKCVRRHSKRKHHGKSKRKHEGKRAHHSRRAGK